MYKKNIIFFKFLYTFILIIKIISNFNYDFNINMKIH